MFKHRKLSWQLKEWLLIASPLVVLLLIWGVIKGRMIVVGKQFPPPRTMLPVGFELYALAVSPQRQLLATGGVGDGIEVWNILNRRRVRTQFTNTITALAFSPDGKTLASASDAVQLWDMQTGKLLRTILRNSPAVWSVAFSPDSKTLAIGGFEGVRLWDVKLGKLLWLMKEPQVQSVAFSPDGKWLNSDNSDYALRAFDMQTHKLLWSQTTLKRVAITDKPPIAFSLDSKILADGSGGTIEWRDPQTGVLLRTIEAHNNGVEAIAFSNDGKLMASASQDWTIKLWDVNTAAWIGTLKGHTAAVTAIAFVPDSKMIISASRDGTVKLWDVR